MHSSQTVQRQWLPRSSPAPSPRRWIPAPPRAHSCFTRPQSTATEAAEAPPEAAVAEAAAATTISAPTVDPEPAAVAPSRAVAAAIPATTLSAAAREARSSGELVVRRFDQQRRPRPQQEQQQQPQQARRRSAVGLPGVGSRRQMLLGGAGALFGGCGAAATAVGSAPIATVAAAAAPAAVACPPGGLVGSGAVVSAALPRGWRALRDPAINRGLATTVAVRQRYGLEGLLPPRVTAPQVEVDRAAAAVQRAEAAAAAVAAPGVGSGSGGGGASLLPYCALMALREADRATFFSLMQLDVERYLPLIYTPAVGDACLAWGSLLPRPTGLSISLEDSGRVQRLVDNWAEGQPEARIAVITDGERILGLGDLGAHGMGIPVGKAAVYGAAGVEPEWILPVALDVGCDTDSVVNDPLYTGLRRPRERGAPYFALVDEVVGALQSRYGPDLLVHWEDVGTAHAFPLLERLESRGVRTFNDDIQATAAVTLAALLGAERLEGVPPLERQTFLFFGAGQANLGVAQLLCAELEARGLGPTEAAARVWLVDRRGLITSDRSDLSAAKGKFAKRRPAGLPPAADPRVAVSDDLARLVAALRPTALIGAAAVGGAFGPRVLSALTQAQPSPSSRPLVFALSNPTSRAECTFRQAVEGTGGRAVFASGTQFPALQVEGGRRLLPAQANNCLVFPGLGAGCVASGAVRVTEGMLLAAARAVAGMASREDLEAECVLPRVGRLGECAREVAAAVARAAAEDMVASSSGGGGRNGGSRDTTCVGPLLLASSSTPASSSASGPGATGMAAAGAQATSDGGKGGGDALMNCLAGLRYRPLQ